MPPNRAIPARYSTTERSDGLTIDATTNAKMSRTAMTHATRARVI